MKKISFSERYGLQQGVIAGTKGNTRRLIPDIILDFPRTGKVNVRKIHMESGVLMMDLSDILGEPYVCAAPRKYQPRYAVGEVVAIAQSYKSIVEQDPENDYGNYYIKQFSYSPGWTNKMFVKSELMPHRIRITNIRVERLQDISEEDCLREGIMEGDFMNTWDRFYYDHWGDVPNHITFRTPRAAFAALIDRISGKGTWRSNPWVFVYEFELVK